jgi:GR25 family glycosyltransferase involved in LPS biosynthesis
MLKEIDPNCRIVVVDDATDSKVETRYMDDYIRLDKNNGKEGWWKTINLLWSKALEKNHKYYIMIPDDALPKRNFFNEAERLWNSINDTNKIAMHLANNNRDRNWTNFKRQDFSSELYLTQTTEFSFICDGTFIQYIIPPVPKSEWSKNPLKSSGVGPRLNKYWIKSGKNIYGVKSSLIYQNYLCTESIMNPLERKLNPWIFK